MMRITFDKGDFVLNEGRSGGAFFILVSGNLSILAENHKGEEVHIGSLKPVSYFGEMALLSKSDRYASVKADEDVVVYMLGKEAFNNVLLAIPQAKQAIEKVAEERRTETDTILYPEQVGEAAANKGSFFSRIIGK